MWAAERGLDAADFLRVAHGRRTSETLRVVAPQLDPVVEVAVLDAKEEVEIRGLRAASGAATVLRCGSAGWRRRRVTSHSTADAVPRRSEVRAPHPSGVRRVVRRPRNFSPLPTEAFAVG